MCGIVGLVDLSGDARPWERPRLDAMLDAIAHRGPDGRGLVSEPGLFLGHTRLAVLDTSNAGAQPMTSVCGRFTLVFNGEIYNFRELRAELAGQGHAFASSGDTEVLLAAWRQWGEGAVERLRGIFAFAIWDRAERRLALVRDRLGIKPLFWWRSGSQLAFASEPLAMFGPVVPMPEPDAADLDAFFTFNYLAAPRTGLADTAQLPPGHLLTMDGSGVTLRQYWAPAFANRQPYADDLADTFDSHARDAVRRQLVADVPVAVFLSGGLDSFLVASSLPEGTAPEAFTLSFAERGFDESPIAGEYARALGLPGHRVGFAWSEQSLRATLADMRELLADASCFPVHQLCAAVRKHATVALSGDGGDELLAGYDTYKVARLSTALHGLPAPARAAARAAARLLPARGRYAPRMVAERLLSASAEGPQRDHASFRRIFDNRTKTRLYDGDFKAAIAGHDPLDDYAALIRAALAAGATDLGARQQADLQFHLPAILAKVDRMSMAHGLEVRVPLLDEEMVDFCMDLADDAKRHKGKGKRLLRQAVAPRIPPAALAQPKAGFLPPVDLWFRADPAMRAVFGDALAWARANLGWLDWKAVDALWSRHRTGAENSGFVLLGVLQFVNWSQQCRRR